MGAKRFNGFFEARLEEGQADDRQVPGAPDTWLQKWIAIAASIGISRRELLEEYYFDEFILTLDAYNELHAIQTEDAVEEVSAEEW